MGCDIHTYVEQQDFDGSWQRAGWPEADQKNYVLGPFDWRDYGVFGFLADVRNYSAVPPIVDARGLPDDVSPSLREAAQNPDYHSGSWLSVEELSGFDYSQTFEDRRVTRGNDGGVTAEMGGGQVTTFRDFLAESFFVDLATLSAMNTIRPTRVVFWFDN